MSATYISKQSPAQKKDAPSASSILDNSSQSEFLQRHADLANSATQRAEAPRPNNTGMPDNLKAGIESLSGFSMDDVRVHYNSSKPATVQALAYTQGTDIHVAPGQEKYLPHEAWHVAQQMAGRVSPTTNINGMPVNDNAALEHEADVMGEKAVQCKSSFNKKNNSFFLSSSIIQRQIVLSKSGSKGNNYHLTLPQIIGDVDLSDPENERTLTTCRSIIENMATILLKHEVNITDYCFNISDNWDKITVKEPKKDDRELTMPINVNDFVEDCKDEDGVIPQKFIPSGVGANACAAQALGSLGICPIAAEVKEDDVNNIAFAWDLFCRTNGINYQNDAGSYILFSKIGLRLDAHFGDDGNRMPFTEFDASKYPPKILVSLWNENDNMGHAIAMINGKIKDEQGLVLGRMNEFIVKYVYSASEALNTEIAKDLSQGSVQSKGGKPPKGWRPPKG